VFARIRKALAGGTATAAAAVVTAVANNGVPGDTEHWAGLAGLAAGAFIAGALGVYFTKKNAEPTA
jgi:uncharacterized membrane protein YfcA